ncbi:MAG: hypothetical protein ACLQVL_16585 [Terriglobia bacterium]
MIKRLALTETVNNARRAVRLVAADGDVIWSTKQKSLGAKFKSASADVADKVAKQLVLSPDQIDKGKRREGVAALLNGDRLTLYRALAG